LYRNGFPKEGATEHPHHKAYSATILYEIVYTVDEQRHIELLINIKTAGNARLIIITNPTTYF
jgi:hypothetical protein